MSPLIRLAQSGSVSLFSRPDPHSQGADSHKRMFLTESGFWVFFALRVAPSAAAACFSNRKGGGGGQAWQAGCESVMERQQGPFSPSCSGLSCPGTDSATEGHRPQTVHHLFTGKDADSCRRFLSCRGRVDCTLLCTCWSS